MGIRLVAIEQRQTVSRDRHHACGHIAVRVVVAQLDWPLAIRILGGPARRARVSKNTLWDGLRFSASPFPGLEISLARIEELCGSGHPCKPIAEYLNINNTPQNPGADNGEGNIDIKYSGVLADHRSRSICS